MFKREHEAAIRIQIRSLAAMCGLDPDAPEVLKILSDTMKEQARILEEIRIEIHNQVQDRGESLGYCLPLGREVFANEPITKEDWIAIASYGPVWPFRF